jgi:hypothetical protein
VGAKIKPSKKPQCVFITEIIWLLFLKEIISVYSDNHTKNVNTLFEQNSHLLSSKYVLPEADENALRVFERKVVRRVYGPVREDERWRIRSNRELEDILRGEDIVKFVKSQRLAWLGHVERMDEERMSRKLLHGKMEGRRRRGRPRKMWLQDLEEDMRVMQVGRWWEKVQSEEEWRHTVKDAKTHRGL